MIEAYPLQWPVGFERTPIPDTSRFENHTLTQATKEVLLELDRLYAYDPIISTNIPLRKDGYPRADYQKRIITDYGVAVYFTLDGEQKVLACDAWDCIEDNLWAIALSIDAMRSLGRWKVSQILERTFTGFTALPDPRDSDCWTVLEIPATKDIEQIRQAYKRLALKYHPDQPGGTHEKMQQLNQARDKALQYANNQS